MKYIIFLSLFLFCCGSADANELSNYKAIKCIIHLHTDISSGTRNLESYVKKAKSAGIDAIVVTDSDWRRWEYGLPFFRRLIKKVVEKKSVKTFGIEKYLNYIKRMNEKYENIVIIDGVQTAPFYYWSGNFFKKTMALNNRNKDMLVVGLSNSKAYKNMPLTANYKSRFNAYQGDKFTLPYQDLIDYVTENKGLVFWSHPEYEENILQNGIRLITVPYHSDLVGTRDYTGFGFFWEGDKKVGKPRGLWDRILTEYCQGKRAFPVWAMGELEEEGLGSKNLDDITNIVYVKQLNKNQILESLKKGKFYLVYKELDWVPLELEEFTVSNELENKTAMMGEQVSFKGSPTIKIRLKHSKNLDKDIKVELIRNNEIIKEFKANSEIEIEYKDQGLKPNQKYYYRIDVRSSGRSRLVSNPIFFRKE